MPPERAEVIAPHGGLVVPPSAPRALADALAELLDRPNGVPQGIDGRLERVCAPEAIGKRYDEIYRSLDASSVQGRP